MQKRAKQKYTHKHGEKIEAGATATSSAEEE